jgi:hypothetical protein
MVITQADLGRLASMIEQRRPLNRDFNALRTSILERYRKGASVERGHLDIKFLESEQRQFSFGEVVRILGLQEAERLRGLLTPRVQTTLKVIASR